MSMGLTDVINQFTNKCLNEKLGNLFVCSVVRPRSALIHNHSIQNNKCDFTIRLDEAIHNVICIYCNIEEIDGDICSRMT